MICGKVSNGTDYVLHYTLKVFITVERSVFCYLLIVFAFVCSFLFRISQMYAPNGMKY